MKGGDGKPCKEVCAALGRTCNSDQQSTLTTNDLVGNAFLKAGYSCRSFHMEANYAGAPFSTGRNNDDCAPITAGSRSSCTGNLYPHHSALCYCDGGDQN